MATESQFDRWRKDIGSNIRKAVEAVTDENGEMVHTDRADTAMAMASITSNLMISERLGQLVQILTMSGDDRFAQMQERIRTGEQILSRITETAESSDLTLEDELMVSITMAEDWLDPDSIVGFATPESVEKGTDPQSQEFADTADPGADPGTDGQPGEGVLEEPFDRAEEDTRGEDES